MLTVVALVLAVLVLPSPWGAIAVIVAAIVDLVETGAFLWWSKRPRVTVGTATLVGRRAVVVRTTGPGLQVKLGGELWEARCSEAVAPGDRVVVRAIEDLTLDVAPDPPDLGEASA